MISEDFQLPNITGKVFEILSPSKAVVKFVFWGVDQRALLMIEKMQICNINLDKDMLISKYLKIGDILIFDCVKKITVDINFCQWDIIRATKLLDYTPNVGLQIVKGIKNQKVSVMDMSEKEGILLYIKNEYTHQIFFHVTSVYINKKRLHTNNNLLNYLSINETVNTDAVPTNPEYNPLRCEFFALTVWIDEKPIIPNFSNEMGTNIIRDISILASNPDSSFIYGNGIITHIINNDYGILMGQVQDTMQWEIILFHRFCTFMLDQKINSTDLRQFFVKDDKVKYLAVKVTEPLQLAQQFKWIAVKVSVYIPESLKTDNRFADSEN